MTDVAAKRAKDAVRDEIRASRAARPPAQRQAARQAVVELVMQRQARDGWRRVAAYEAWPSEPSSPELLSALRDAGVEVFVPIERDDHDLDWVPWPTRPAGAATELSGVDAVLVPALAVARDGTRLGRGRGCYDRALAAAPDVAIIAVIFDGELLDHLPAEPHDRPVGAVVTPSGWPPIEVRESGDGSGG